nr:hypothetical protein [Endozoicomonas sp.]
MEKKIRSLKPNLLKSEIDGHLIHLAAAKSGSLEVLTYLVSIKGQINLIDKHGHTPVMIAFKNNRGWITIDTLLSAKPDPTIRDPDTRMNLLRLVIGAGYYNHFVTLGQAHSELVWQLDIDQTSPVAKAMEMGLITRTIAEKLFGHDNAACHDKTPKHRAISAYSRQSGQPDPIAARRKQSAATVQQDLKTGKQVDEAFWEKIKKAAPTNNKEEIRSLYANRNEHCFDEKYGRYDHVAFISIMDDKKRLGHT